MYVVTGGVLHRSLLTPEATGTHGTGPARDPSGPSLPFSPVPGVVTVRVTSPDRAGKAEAGAAWGGGSSGLSARVKAAKDRAEGAGADLRAKEVAEAAAGEGLTALSLARQRMAGSPLEASPSATEPPESPRASEGGVPSSPRPWKLRVSPPPPVAPLATLTPGEAVEEDGARDASDGAGMGAARGWHLLSALLSGHGSDGPPGCIWPGLARGMPP